jgi:hypothetical protein
MANTLPKIEILETGVDVYTPHANVSGPNLNAQFAWPAPDYVGQKISEEYRRVSLESARLLVASPAMLATLRETLDAVRLGPDQVVGFDRGGQRQKDFEKGWNAAKEQVWARLVSILPTLDGLADVDPE